MIPLNVLMAVGRVLNFIVTSVLVPVNNHPGGGLCLLRSCNDHFCLPFGILWPLGGGPRLIVVAVATWIAVCWGAWHGNGLIGFFVG
jgi:hypothetical protein